MDNTGRSDQFTVTVTDDCTPLPVELLSFTGNCIGREVELSWSTASETNSDYYRIEVSFNGYDYQILGQVPAAGNSSNLRYYSWKDNLFVGNVAYYRLVQVDFNGVSKAYGPISVSSDCLNESGTSILNNPSSTSIDLVLNSGKNQNVPAEIYVFSIDGRLVMHKPVIVEKGMNLISIPIEFLAAGPYMINIEWESETESLIFIKP